MVWDGDSHMYGNADPANAMPVFVNQYSLFQPARFSNVSANGLTSQNVASLYQGLTQFYWPVNTQVPATYWLHVGSNNITGSQSGATIYASVAAILAQAKLNGFQVGVTTPWSDPSFSGAQNTALAQYEASIATDPSITTGLLIYGTTMFPSPNTGPYFLSSNNHLNPTGQAYYAAQVYALLAALIL